MLIMLEGFNLNNFLGSTQLPDSSMKLFGKKGVHYAPKYEVNVKNLIIFLPLRFYEKSFFGNFQVSKTAILTIPLI